MIRFSEGSKLSYKQLDTVFTTAFNVLEALPPVAINQLLEGYGGDVDNLLTEIFTQTNNVLTLNSTLDTERLNYIDQLEESMDETLKVQSYNYFKTTMLPNFRQGWRNLEWGNMVQLYPNSAYLAARSHGKCFAAGTRILMADFTVKNVEDIYPGMEVMGMDFTPRKVLTRHIGRAQMFRVEQEDGMPYAVNRAHILCLWDKRSKQFVEIEMGKFLKYEPKKQRRFQGYKIFSYDKPVIVRTDIKVEGIGEESYYGFMCDGDHRFQLEDGTVVHNSYEFCMAFPLWRLYSYHRPNFMRPDTPDNKNRQETCIITNTEKLGKEHIDKVVEEIRINEAIAAKLNPGGKASLAATSIECENGTKLHLRGKDGFIRGLHVGAAVSDDLPDESSIYSLEQREKLRDLFKGAITPIVEPYGYNIVDGCVTPDTLVLTDNGIFEIGELAPVPITSDKGYYPYGKEVYNGTKLEIANEYYINGLTKTKVITLKKGLKLETSYIHPIMVCNEKGLFEWRKAKDLKVGDFVAIKVGAGVWGKPLKVSDDDLYQIGLCIADGVLSESRVSIIKGVKGIRDYLINEQEFRPVRGRLSMRYYRNEKSKLFQSLGYKIGLLSHTKEIPNKILHSGERELCKFLSGYFDGDGCMTIDDSGHCHVSCFSVSEKLIKQIQFVLLNMGIVSSVNPKKCQSSKKVKSNRIGYLLRITSQEMVHIFMEKIGFPHSGKGDKYRNISNTLIDCSVMQIPYQSELMKRIRKEISLTAKDKKKYGLEKLRFKSRNTISIHKRFELEKVVKWVKGSGFENEDTRTFIKNVESGYVFLPIKKIEESESITVDFSMKETHSFISNGIVSHNTPYQADDLYSDLKKDPKFKVFEYPAIFPDGRLLAPDRFTFKKLMEEKKSLGTLVFSREYLVVPISDDSTIFPWEILMRSTIGMENIKLVENIVSFPIKLTRVVIGCDFAVSGNVGADFTCYTVWGRDIQGNYYLLYIYRKKGLSHNEQISRIEQLNHAFHPHEIVVENNGFQNILADMCVQRGIKNIHPFTTTSGNKKDLRTGWASLAALYERGVLKCPYHPDTRERVDQMFGEFNSVAFRSDKGTLESISGHDDTVSSSFMAINRLRENTVLIKVDSV